MDSGDEESFRWNAGGWFGGQIGASLWLGILGALIVFSDVPAGLLALASFVILNAVGLLLWSLRGSLDAYPASQIFLAVCTVVVGVAVLFLGTREASLQYGGLPIWIPLIFPAAMFMLHLRRPRRYR